MPKDKPNLPKKIRIKNKDSIIMDYENKGLNLVRRDDIFVFYNIKNVNADTNMYGWEMSLPLSFFPCELQMEISVNIWVPVFEFQNVELNSFVSSYIGRRQFLQKSRFYKGICFKI